MGSKKEFFINALHIFILVSLSFAQPLYVISQFAEFFVAHNAGPVEIMLFILIPCLLVPVFFVALEITAGLFHRRAGILMHYLIVTSVSSVIALVLFKKYAGGYPGGVLLSGAVFLGITAGLAYARFHEVKKFVTILLPVIFIFPYFFLFKTPVNRVVFPGERHSEYQIKAEDTPDIVFVLFDEFPVTSLMDRDRMIDPVRYPNFASLAGDSYWFRNATAVSDNTAEAVPAIMSGMYPEGKNLPTSIEYPDNIFTLLGGVYDLKVTEPVTYLCPERLCEKKKGSLLVRMNSMLADLSLVYLHILLPADVSYGLPAVTRSWKGFANSGGHDESNKAVKSGNYFREVIDKFVGIALKEPGKDRGRIFRRFIGSIQPSEKPTLYFQHSYLPHTPWIYLPSGKKYRQKAFRINGLLNKQWAEDEAFVIEAYQRHLLQVGFVDKLLGELIEKLKQEGIYDGCLLIITADHGVSFRRNDFYRDITKTNYPDIMPVPLFIKRPFQKKGVMSDRNIETIDIVPTIADILGITVPWDVDGQSAFDTSRPERKEKIIYGSGKRKGVRNVFGKTLDAKYHALSRKTAIFGDGEEQRGFSMTGLHNNLIGLNVHDLEKHGKTDLEITIDQEQFFPDIDLNSPFIPAEITGSVFSVRSGEEPIVLAVAINDTIHAVTQAISTREGDALFSAVVPEESFRSGSNTVKIFKVSEESGRPSLSRIKNLAHVTYSLETTSKGEKLLISSDGSSFPVNPDALQGSLGFGDIRHNQVVLAGWAADVKDRQPAGAIVVFLNNEFLFAGRTDQERPDVAEHIGIPELQKTGFRFWFPASIVQDEARVSIRIFAVSRSGVATELHYPEWFRWSGN
jgi:hypothetical protein